MRRRSASVRRRRTAFLTALGAVILVAAFAPTASAQAVGSATVYQHQITGPPSQRLNLVILGDGYTASEQWKFHRDVDRNLNVFWSVEPFRTYRNYFNIYLLEINSQDSGISCDPDDGNVKRNTPLRLGFANNCPAPILARGITYGPALGTGGCPAINAPGCTGTQQHNLFMSTYLAPLGVSGQNVQTLGIANTFTYGGIGGTQATTSGGSPQGPLISTHELGHSLGTMADEYPYSNREVPGGTAPNTEPGSFHHTRMTEAQMISGQAKWFRWLCEESLSGGMITTRDSTCGAPHEGGSASFTRNIWRPSEHSMMRWIGNYFDQIGREHMTGRITGQRNANAMTVLNTPLGQVGPNDVVWVETLHPMDHELTVTWRINGVVVPNTNNSRNLNLTGLVSAGNTVQATVQDQTEFVRDPALLNGPRFTQTRSWTVGTPLTPNAATAAITSSSQTVHPVRGDEWIFVETPHPTDRILDVTWRLDGNVVPNPNNSRNFDLGAQNLSAATHTLSATVTDPANPGVSETRTWTVDNVKPTAPRTLSTPLQTFSKPAQPPEYVYNGPSFDMLLEPVDDQAGFVVGELRLNRDGWFNYFGFPEQPFGTPFKFHVNGSNVKALTYGNLGTGGLSRATFEQCPFILPCPSGFVSGFVPGWGKHTVEHRAIDAAGNIGDAEEFVAYVLPFEVTHDVSESAVEGGSASSSFTIRNTLTTGPSFSWTISEAPSTCTEPGDVSWLSATTSATTDAGQTATVDVSLDATGLTAPTVYTAKLCVEFEGDAVYEVPVSFQVQYPFDGFLATFKNPPVLNAAHSNNVQTFWFRLGGGTNRGLGILADASSRQVDCATGAPIGGFEPAESPHWDSLAYNAQTRRYSFLWQTNTGYKGTCRELVLTLDDQSTHSVLLQFVK